VKTTRRPVRRVAALYDVHGNAPALDAVLNEVTALGVDLIVVGGDMLPGPLPRESLAALAGRATPTLFICGNGERDVIAAHGGAELGSLPAAARGVVRWTAGAVSPEELAAIAAWPDTVQLSIEGVGAVLFCHATPRSDRELFTERTPQDRILPAFEGVDARVVVCGHTHVQFDRTIGETRVVNAGSVGMPFGEPGAYWLLLGPDVELRRTDYDLDAAARRISVCEYPAAEAFARDNVLHPPSAEAMVAMFEEAVSRAGES
jgi:predicted phosphodiesterase